MKNRSILRKYAAILTLAISAIVLLPIACTEKKHDEVIPVTGVTLNTSDALLLAGKTLALDAIVEPAEATNKTVTWRTDDDHVATVNTAGEITAIALGTAMITAFTDDGKYTATCTVTVVKTYTITMTTQAAEVTLGLAIPLETDLFIDWGDGIEGKINDADYNYPCDVGFSLSFSHNYSDVSSHNITITGNILSLDCGNNQLTTLDVSSATALLWFRCNSNQLTKLDVSRILSLKICIALKIS